VAAAQAFVDGSTTEKVDEVAFEEVDAEEAIDADEDAAAEAAAVVGAAEATAADQRSSPQSTI
jgi:hypothetical protein